MPRCKSSAGSHLVIMNDCSFFYLLLFRSTQLIHIGYTGRERLIQESRLFSQFMVMLAVITQIPTLCYGMPSHWMANTTSLYLTMDPSVDHRVMFKWCTMLITSVSAHQITLISLLVLVCHVVVSHVLGTQLEPMFVVIWPNAYHSVCIRLSVRFKRIPFLKIMYSICWRFILSFGCSRTLDWGRHSIESERCWPRAYSANECWSPRRVGLYRTCRCLCKQWNFAAVLCWRNQ